MKDGKLIQFTERLSQGKLSDHQNDLWISSVNTNEAGRYTCHAVNEVGQLNTDFELEVIGKLYKLNFQLNISNIFKFSTTRICL